MSVARNRRAGSQDDTASGEVAPIRKAAILVVSLEQPLASKLLAQLERPTVEAITLEIARLERIDPLEQEAVLEEFYELGVRRLRFVFDDLVHLESSQVREAFLDDQAPIWALALAGASRSLQSRVLEALEPPSSRRLRGLLGNLGPFRLQDAESAQAELTERLRHLHDRGLITLPAPKEREAILV